MKSPIKRVLSFLLSAAASVSILSGTAVGVSAENDASGLTASEICQEMGVGWNLGNSLDANSVYGLDSETSWGNPKTTKAMIDAVRDKGFTCVRLPVTWFNHMDGNYKVDEAWMARVKEVVDYCIDDGMYVILNSHHDTWNKTVESNYSAASYELKTLWKQIAEYFGSYDRHLIFEGMNEPRNYEGEHEWDGGTSEMRQVVNKLNADFVNTVRSTGGINSTRCLMIPSYAASVEYAAMFDLKVPDDDNIIVSLHAYSPWNFAYNIEAGSTDVFSQAMEIELDAIFKNISNLFISKGIPVCIGEFSATNKNNIEERAKWGAYYAKKAKTLGISCVIWDNNYYGSGSNEAHGHLNRSSLTWYDDQVVDSIINSYKNTKIDIPEPIKVPDLSKAKCTVLSNETLTGTGYTPTSAIPFDFSKMKDNCYIAVDFSGSANPKLVLQDNREYKIWCEVSAYVIDNGTAYYSYNDLAEAYSSQYQIQYGEKPSNPLYQAFQCFVTGAGSDVTVTKVVYAEFDSTPIETKSIEECTVSLSGNSFNYTGSEITPSVKVTDGSKVLVKGTDYTVSYKNNVDAGTAQAVIKGQGNYSGTVTKYFTIVKAQENITDITKCDITLSSLNFTYTGQPCKPKVTVKAGDKILVLGTDYSVRYINNTEVGTASVRISGKGDYTGSVEKTFVISESSKKNIAACTITLNKGVFKATGNAVKPKVTITDGGKTLALGTDYAVRYVDNVNPGTAQIVIAGKGDYTGLVNKTFKILDPNAKDISQCSVNLNKNSFKYTGNAVKPQITVQDGNKVLTRGTDYNIRFVNNVNVGTAEVIVSGTGNYQGMVSKTFNITY